MNRSASLLERTISGALDRRAARRATTAPAGWSFDLGNGKPLPVEARWEDPWLRLRAPLAPAGPAEPWPLLLLNAKLPGAARLVRCGRSGAVELQADLPLHEAGLVSQRVDAACAAIHGVGALLAEKPEAGLGEPAAPKEDAAEPSWVRLAAEHGWRLEPRETGRFVVELDAPGLSSQATVEPLDGEVSLWIEVLKSGSLSEQSRRAAGLFLLTLTGRLRMVRGSATAHDLPAIRLEIRLPASPCGTELDLALAALSLACRWCTRELRGLADEQLASTYLNYTNTED